MNLFWKIVIFSKFIRVRSRHIASWTRNKNPDLLAFCLDYVRTKLGMEAVKGLRQIRNKTVIEQLLLVARSQPGLLADEALRTIEVLDTGGHYRENIERTKTNNANYIAAKPSYKTTPINRKQRMQRLEEVRAQLKKRMR